MTPKGCEGEGPVTTLIAFFFLTIPAIVAFSGDTGLLSDSF